MALRSKKTNLDLYKRKDEIMKGKIIAIANQKGGVGKTTTTRNLGTELVKQGKKVLLIDFDPQGNLSMSMGIDNEEVPTIADLMQLEIDEEPLPDREDIVIHVDGIDIIPANLVLASIETNLVVISCREFILKTILAKYKSEYDYILLDCGPFLGMLLINALTAADSIIIPVEGQYLSAKGLELLLQSVAKTRRKLNPSLEIEGILITKIDTRTNAYKEILQMIDEAYGKLNIFKNVVPLRVAVEKSIRNHESIANFEKNSDAAKAYAGLAEELLKMNK